MLTRAYSVLTVKSVNEDERIIEGVATTPSTDRMGDVVSPKGAKFTLPIPLLWQHDSGQPIGHVERAKVSDEGISVIARIAKIQEPGRFKDRLDEAWQSIKSGLVRGLSIGFRATEDPKPIKGTFGLLFDSWELLELSAVTVPANADASITAIKSIDDQLLAASGKAQQVVRLDSSPGVSGQRNTVPKGRDMKTSEQIASFEAKRSANVARMEEVMKKASEEGRTLDEQETQEYTDLEGDVSKIDDHLPRLKRLEKTLVQNAQPIPSAIATRTDADGAARPYGTGVRAMANVPKGMAMARYVKAIAASKASGGMYSPLQYAESQKGWIDTTPQVVQYLRTAVPGGTSTASAWADDLVYAQNLANEFIELLYPATILGRLTGLRRVPFNIRVGSQTAGGTAYWIGESLSIPVSKLQTDNVTLTIAKAAGLMVITKELARLSSPSAEALVRQDLIDTVTKFLDVQFIDPNYGPNTTSGAPGAVTYGIPVAQVRAASGTTAAALRADFAALMDPLFTANVHTMAAAFVMSPYIAMKIGMINTSLGTREFPDINMNGGSLFGLPVITSMSAYVAGSPQYGHMIVLLSPSDIFMADDGGFEIDASGDVSLQMDDAPTNNTGTPTGTSVTSMWQTESIAIKLVRYINWKRRRSTAVGYISGAAYADA